MLRCIHGVGWGHVNVQGNRLGGTQVLDRIWDSLKRTCLALWVLDYSTVVPGCHALALAALCMDVVLETQDLEWRIRCFRKFRSFDVQSEWRLGLLEITSRRQARSEKQELSKTRMGMRWSFRKKCLVRNDVFAIAKYKMLKKWGAPTALLTLPHEAFEDGMYQSTVNNGMWIENRIKVTYE